jgi:hypothetical protein
MNRLASPHVTNSRCKTEHSHDDQERVIHLGLHVELNSVLGLLGWRAAVGERPATFQDRV